MDAVQMRMLGVAFGPPTMTKACAGLRRIREDGADCVELRLDLFSEKFELSVLLRERGKLPVVVTLRPPEQGGRCALPPEERLKLLLQAAELGAEYVDLEWDAATPEAQRAVRAAGAKVIVSRHDFSGMPHRLHEWWRQLADQGADVVKVVGTARDVRDCLQVFRALEQVDRPTIAIAMGAAGLPSRVLSLRSPRCLLTYAALEDGGGTAPGQISLRAMRETYRVERLRQQTRVYGLLGPHSELGQLGAYNRWFADEDIDAVAVPFVASSDAAGVIAAFRGLPVHGWHVHGEALQREVPRALDSVSKKATAQGKVNAVMRRADGALYGEWVESPREQFELWR